MAEDRHDYEIEQNQTPSTLALRLMPDSNAADWQVTRFYPDTATPPQQVATSWEQSDSFLQTLQTFWQLSRQMLTAPSDIERLHAHAVALGEQLADVLTTQDRSYLTTQPADRGTPCLVIESPDEAILSLPWELLRLQNQFVVREGILDVMRSVLIDAPPTPLRSDSPFTLLMTVAAPEPSTLRDEDEERYRLLRAISPPVIPVLNETGEFEELLASVNAATPTFGIHFSGMRRHAVLVTGRGRRLPVRPVARPDNGPDANLIFLWH